MRPTMVSKASFLLLGCFLVAGATPPASAAAWLRPPALAGSQAASPDSVFSAKFPVAIHLHDSDAHALALQTWGRALLRSNPDIAAIFEQDAGIMEFTRILGVVAQMAGTDSWETVGALLGRGGTVFLRPTDAPEPDLVAITQPRDPAVAGRVLNTVQVLAGMNRPNDGTRSYEHAGVRVFRLGERLHQCLVNDLVVVATSRELIEEAIGAASGIASTPNPAVKEPGVAVRVSLDLSGLRPALRALNGPAANPLAEFLLGGWRASALTADRMTLTIAPTPGGVRASLRTLGTPNREAVEPFRDRSIRPALFPRSAIPGLLGEVSLARDWSTLFADREVRLTPEGASQAAQFATTISTLLGGVGFTDELLPEIDGPVRVVAVERDWSTEAYRVSPTLPAFALVLPLKSAAGADLPRRVESAAQGLMSILAMEQLNQGGPPMRLDLDKHEGVRIVFSSFDPAALESGEAGQPAVADLRYNFMPASAVIPTPSGSSVFVFASSPDLVRTLITAVQSPAGPIDRTPGDEVVLEGPAITRLLSQNHDELVASDMLKRDCDRAEATVRIDALVALSRLVRSISLSSTVSETGCSADLRLTLNQTGTAEEQP